MNILALDTCTESCSAALLYQGDLFERIERTQRGHSDLILGMMDELFIQAGTSISSIDTMAFGRGPGSFTGVRVGVGVAQGIAFARDIPVVPISSLAAVAQDAANKYQAEYIAVAMDARMGEVYCARYQTVDGIVHLLGKERVCPPEQFLPEGNQTWLAAGTGWGIFDTVLQHNFADNVSKVSVEHFPFASQIIKLAQVEIAAGRLLPAEEAMPVYLRNNVAKKKGEQ